ncbi:hypothetical protein [Amycolatopsis palatopharyngis]|uniref:hypothetical protein n=1 Tax=Amycolatopsis palatopharyngis TaxID=187982 RepID=UPI000E27951E|nr:hypothetical protein [Amycolatopsis palatopharyngis]
MPATQVLGGVRDGEDIAAAIGDHLSCLEELCEVLEVTNPVATCFTPLLGSWSELESEAERWRAAAAAVADAAQDAEAPLGKLDGAWEGKDADAFVAYIGSVVAASSEAQEAIGLFASALDETATGVRRIVLDMAEVLVDTAETVSESAAMAVGGADTARLQLEDTHRHVRALSDAAEDVLRDFAQLCAAVSEDGDDDAQVGQARTERRSPEERFRFTDDAPQEAGGGSASHGNTDGAAGPEASVDEAPIGGGAAAAQVGGVGGGEPDPVDGEARGRSASEEASEFGAGAVTGAAAGAVAGGAVRAAGAPMMGGMMPMGAMGAASGQGGDKEHRTKQRVVTEPNELFGRPEQVAPPVIGEEKPK